MRRLGLIHTVTRLAPTFADLADELLPGVETVVVADEMLLKDTIRNGSVSKATTNRLSEHVDALQCFGVDAVLVTCSSIGREVDEIAAVSRVPVYRVDRPMAQRAVTLGSSVGVIATLPTTLRPTAELVELSARDSGREVEVVSRLCVGAFESLERGEPERHDAIVAEELQRLSGIVDVIVLAQASMARIVSAGPRTATPILSSPLPAVERVAEMHARSSSAGRR